MTSGGSKCDACRRPRRQCNCLPPNSVGSQHVCPWCGTEFGVLDLGIVHCPCGSVFSASVRIEAVSVPVSKNAKVEGE